MPQVVYPRYFPVVSVRYLFNSQAAVNFRIPLRKQLKVVLLYAEIIQ